MAAVLNICDTITGSVKKEKQVFIKSGKSPTTVGWLLLAGSCYSFLFFEIKSLKLVSFCAKI